MSGFSGGGPPKGSLRLLKKKMKSGQTGAAAARRSATSGTMEYAAAGRNEQEDTSSMQGSHRFQSKQRASGAEFGSDERPIRQGPGMGTFQTSAAASAETTGAANSTHPNAELEGSSSHQPDLKFFSKPAIKWTNPNGQKCIPVRGESRCLCGCRKKVHKWDGKRFRCTKPGCKCRNFYFIVAEGAWKLRCSCKHHATDHDPAPGPHRCTRRNCKCNGFVSPWVCNCGAPWTAHKQSVEMVKFVSVDGTEMPASMFAQMAGIDPNGEGIAPEINRVARDPKFGIEKY